MATECCCCCCCCCCRPKLFKFGGQKNTTSHGVPRNMWEDVFLCKKKQFPRNNCLLTCRHASTASLAIGVNSEPLIGQPCMGNHTLGTSFDESNGSAAKAVMSSGSGQEHLRLGGPNNNCGLLCAILVVATFRVARLTLRTRKLWLGGVATDRNASVTLACVSFHYMFPVFVLLAQKKTENEKKGK